MSIQNIKRIGLLLFFSSLIVFQAQSNIVILNGLTHEDTSSPGEKYRGSIQVQNAGTEARTVRVYIRDYWYTYQGESRHDEPGTQERSNANWINFSPKLLTLQPDERAIVDFEVNTPMNDSLCGTYWSVIMVEGLVPQDTAKTAGLKIHTAIRYAVQIITNIEETGERDLQFIGLELDDSQEQNVLNVAVKNTGERMLKPELSMEIFNNTGESMGIFKAERRKTFPGTSILLSLSLVGVEPGSYTAVLVANCDADHIFGTNFTLEI